LESIVLKDVGVFVDTRVDFPPIDSTSADQKAEIHLFTGANGCGKSTLLYALASVFDDLSGGRLARRRFLSPSSFIAFKFSESYGQFGAHYPSEDPQFSCEFGPVQRWFEDKSQGIYGAIPLRDFTGQGNPTAIAAYKTDQANFFPGSAVQSGIKFGYAAFAYSGQRTLTAVPLGAIQQITNSPFENSLSFDSTVRPQVLVQWIANNRAQAALARDDGERDAGALYDAALAKITTAIRDICGLIVHFKMQRSPLSVSVVVDGQAIPFDGLPDGLKSIISWVADLAIRLESIPWIDVARDVFEQRIFLFLDEIDVHLHPKWQRRILPAIQRMLPNAQIFVSTHSPFVVGSVDDAWVYRLPERGRGAGRTIIPLRSGAGKSYRLILEEIFGIDKEFDVETEAMFDKFYEARDAFMKQPTDSGALISMGVQLAERGEEARTIVETELRQTSRRTGVEVRIA
jgi:energy-coupling factor transporter ATP-binding protein EcfA2